MKKWILIITVFITFCHVCIADLFLDMTTIGNPGNTADLFYEGNPHRPEDDIWLGGVNYTYQIGTYEVTVAQYTEFLNATAASDPHGLYDIGMSDAFGNNRDYIISRSGEDGSYTYTVVAGKENQPIRFVDFYDSARFCNWLHNGQGTGDTENGSYNLSLAAPWMVREEGARWSLPSEDEWYKAAYYDPGSESYFDYPNWSDAVPADPTDETTTREMNFGHDPWGMGMAQPTHPSEKPPDTAPTVSMTWVEMSKSGPTVSTVTDDIHGGGVNDAPYLSSEVRLTREPDVGSGLNGFRVAHVIPEPGTVALLIVGGLVSILRRKNTRMNMWGHEGWDKAVVGRDLDT